MITLGATNQSLKVVLGGAVTTFQLPVVVAYAEYHDGNGTLTNATVTNGTNNTTLVTILSAPASGYARVVEHISVYNKDTVSATVSVIFDDNGTSREIFKATLNAGNTLQYTKDHGWSDGSSGSSSSLSDGDKGDITVSSSGTVWEIDAGAVGTTELADDAVTYAKIQNVSATDRLLGRDTAGAGDVEELTVGGGISFTGSGGIQTSAFTGDVTKSAGGTALTIANDAVTYAKMQNVSATSRVLGRNTSGAGDTEEVTATQVLDWIGSTQGNVLYRGASAWSALAVGTSGQVLTSGGAGANPSWATVGTLTDGNKGDITVSSSGTVWTVNDDSVTLAILQSIPGLSVVCNPTSLSGTPGALAATSAGQVLMYEVGGTELVWSLVVTDAIIDDAVSNAKLRNSSALSVIGRSANSTGDPGDIAAGSDGQVLRRSGTTLGFGTIATAGITDDAVTYAKMQDVSATDRLLGRDTTGSGVIEELTVGGGIEFTGSGGIQTSAFTGDVTKSAGGTALTIANDAVTYAKMQDVTDNKLLGRSAGSSGDCQEIAIGSGLTLASGTLSASGGGSAPAWTKIFANNNFI